MQVILFNLNGSYGTLTGVYVRLVVHRGTIPLFKLHQHLGQFLQGLTLQTCSQFRVLRNRRQLVALQHSLDIQTGTATEDGCDTPTYYIIIDIEEVLLILEQVLLRARLADIDKVVGNG